MSRVFYTDEMVLFLQNHASGTPLKVLADQFNAQFGTDLNAKAVGACLSRRGLGNGMFHQRSVFPENVRQFMAINCKGNRAREMAALLNDTFGTNYTEKQVSSYYRKHGLRSGVAARYMPIGTLIFRKGEWYYEKVAEGPNSNENWKSKHIMVWEAANGPVPDGHMITFLNGDRTDYALENLALCPYDVGMEMNHAKLRFSDARLTKTGMLIAKVNLQTRAKQKKRRQADEPKSE